MTMEEGSPSSHFVSNLALRIKAKFNHKRQDTSAKKSKVSQEGEVESSATREKGENHLGKSQNSSKPDTNDIREKTKKWFDDVDIERSTELSALHLHVSDITIKLPESSSEDEDLKTLVKYANSPPATVGDSKRSIDMLQIYLDSRKLKENNKIQEAERKRKEKESQRGEFSTKLHGIIDSLTPHMTKVFGFVLTVLQGSVQVLQATAFLASEITFQTHYEVAIKAIMLFMTAYEKSKELTDDVVSMFDKIGIYGQEMETLQDVIKSAPMSRAINKLFVSSVTLIVSAGSYMNHGTLSKMAKYLGGGNDRLNELIKAVKNDYAELARVMNFAHVMVTLSSHENIREIGSNVDKLMQQLSLLNDAMNPEMSKQLQTVFDHSGFQADLHVQSLRAELFDGPYEPTEEMAFNDSERVFLSPTDRWPRQLRGFSPFIERHSTTTEQQELKAHRPLVWISGHASRRNVSWVSTFSVDLITHFRELGFFDLAYVFCKRGQGQRYTPTLLMKGLTTQILECHPSVAIRNVRRLSKQRFRDIGRAEKSGDKAHETGNLVWALLEDMLRLIEIAPEFQTRTVLLLIDRLDLCISEEGFSVLNDLVPRLQAISQKITRIQVMVTTARLSPLGIPTLRKGPELLQAYGKKCHG